MLDSKATISQVLHPVCYDDFFENILGKKPWFYVGDENGVKKHLAGPDPKAGLLNDYKKYSAKLTCHSHAPQVPPPEPRDVESPQAFLSLIHEYHRLGYTVRIPDVTELSSQLSQFTRSLESVINNPVNVVVFWSAPGNAAPVHYDEVDVIVIQLVGNKKWFVSNKPSTLPNKWKNAGEGQPDIGAYQTIDVGPGDLMYLPRGTVHTVQSTSESIHLSIGFTPVTVRESIGAALDLLSEFEIDLRKSVSPRNDVFDKRLVGSQIREGLQKLLDKCHSDEFIEMAMRRRRARMIAELPKLQPAKLSQAITIDTKVSHNPLAMVELISTSEIIDLCQPGEHILIHKGVEKAIQFILDNPVFKVGQLPQEFPADVRIALVSRLTNSGLLLTG